MKTDQLQHECEKCGKKFHSTPKEGKPTIDRKWCNDCIAESFKGVYDVMREMGNLGNCKKCKIQMYQVILVKKDEQGKPLEPILHPEYCENCSEE